MAETPLSGRRVLIVEDDYFLAEDLKAELESKGAEVVGPAGRVSDALALLANAQRLDGAVLDVNLGGETAYPIADALRAKKIPFVFVTGYDASFIPAAYADVTRCEKPVDSARVATVLFPSEPSR